MTEDERKDFDGEIMRLVTSTGAIYVKDQPWPPPPGMPQEPIAVGRILPDDDRELYLVYAYPMTEQDLTIENVDSAGNKTSQRIVDKEGRTVEPIYHNMRLSLIAEIPYDRCIVERFALLEEAEKVCKMKLQAAIEYLNPEEEPEPPATDGPQG